MEEAWPDPKNWLGHPAMQEALPLIVALELLGEQARFVGGCVRDAILGRPIRDVDLATTAQPAWVMNVLKERGYRVVPTGLQHGTVSVVLSGGTVEITTLRHDVETDGRHAKVAFTTDWEADAARRDLTINSMSLDRDGRLHDPFCGLQDLHDGKVCFVGDPRGRITEDVLRILRFFRFHAWYGKGDADAESVLACAELAHLIPRLSAERITKEWLTLLAAPDPLPCCRLMHERGVLAHFLPEIVSCDRLAALIQVSRGYDIQCLSLLRMAALVPPACDVRVLALRMKFSGAQTRYLVSVCQDTAPAHADMSWPDLHRCIDRQGRAATQGQMLLAAADGKGREKLSAAMDEVAVWETPPRPYDGLDAQRLGLMQGQELGKVIQEMDAWWQGQDFQPDRAACLEHMEQIIKAR